MSSEKEIKELREYNIENFNVHSILVQGEQIEWQLDFKEGIINRHAKSTAMITNARVIFIDRLNARVTQSLLIKDTEVAIMNRHTVSNSAGGGTYYRGFYNSSRSGTSRTIGTLIFMVNGVTRITLGGVGDPQGVKNLFTAIKKQITKVNQERSRPPPVRRTASVTARISSPDNSKLDKDVKYCPNCGTELSIDSSFCNKCGRAQA